MQTIMCWVGNYAPNTLFFNIYWQGKKIIDEYTKKEMHFCFIPKHHSKKIY